MGLSGGFGIFPRTKNARLLNYKGFLSSLDFICVPFTNIKRNRMKLVLDK